MYICICTPLPIFSKARPEKKQVVDAATQEHSTTQAVAVTKVLDDDNLLREIIVRVGFPTNLVHAALVCKRWLGHASDPKFLSRFRKRHPPRLLGYYITGQCILSESPDVARFVPMLPQPPELATVMCRLKSYNFSTHKIMHCHNGTIFTMHPEETIWAYEVHRPLCAETDLQIFTPFPCVQDHNIQIYSAILSKEDASGLSYFYVLGEYSKEAGKSTMHVYMFQDGVWRTQALATCHHRLPIYLKALFVSNKIYMPATNGDDIVVLDLMASSFSTIQLPEGVKYDCFKSRLSCADDVSSVYLIHVMEFQLCIWLHKGDNWLLIDAICLNEMIATLGVPDHTLEDEDIANVLIHHVRDYLQFVVLHMGECIFYLDMKCKTLCKVYEMTENEFFGGMNPFMMMWPPTFPALKDDRARFVF
ncbi:unnamed protein product [Alopecurus aequalis]